MQKVESLVEEKLRFRGLINAISQSIPILFYGISVFYGGILVANHEINYKVVIRFVEEFSMLNNKLIKSILSSF